MKSRDTPAGSEKIPATAVDDVALPNPRFEASYRRLFGGEIAVGGQGDAFFAAFYRRFLSNPEIARLFERVDMARQAEMLRRSLFTLASFYVLDQVSPELRRLAEIHQRLGLKPQMFDFWLQCLLQTVEEFDPCCSCRTALPGENEPECRSDDARSCRAQGCDEATLLAWGWALAPGITYVRIVLDQ